MWPCTVKFLGLATLINYFKQVFFSGFTTHIPWYLTAGSSGHSQLGHSVFACEKHFFFRLVMFSFLFIFQGKMQVLDYILAMTKSTTTDKVDCYVAASQVIVSYPFKLMTEHNLALNINIELS